MWRAARALAPPAIFPHPLDPLSLARGSLPGCSTNGTRKPHAVITNKPTGTKKLAVAEEKPSAGKKPAVAAVKKADVPAAGKKKADAAVAAKKAAAVKNARSRKTAVNSTKKLAKAARARSNGVFVVTEVVNLVGGTPPRKNKRNQVAFLPPIADHVLQFAAAADFTTAGVAGAAIGLLCASDRLIVGGFGV
jgi:hypothetical protein